MSTNPQPFSRLDHPDPKTQQMMQDVYNKLQQIQAAVSDLTARVKKLESKP